MYLFVKSRRSEHTHPAKIYKSPQPDSATTNPDAPFPPFFTTYKKRWYRWDEMRRKETDCDLFFAHKFQFTRKVSDFFVHFPVFSLVWTWLRRLEVAGRNKRVNSTFILLPPRFPPSSLSPLSLSLRAILLSLLHGRRCCGVDEAITHAGTVT